MRKIQQNTNRKHFFVLFDAQCILGVFCAHIFQSRSNLSIDGRLEKIYLNNVFALKRPDITTKRQIVTYVDVFASKYHVPVMFSDACCLLTRKKLVKMWAIMDEIKTTG